MRRLLFIVLSIVIAAIAFFIITTATSSPKPVTFVASESTPIDTFKTGNSIVHTIVFSSDKLYCYTTDIDSYKIYSLNNINAFRQFLSEKKSQYGDSLIVMIKPTYKATYEDVVKILDEMTINDVKTYHIVDLGLHEKQKLNTKSWSDPPPPVTIHTPTSMTTTKIDSIGHNEIRLVFEFDKNEDLFYSIETIKGKTTSKKLLDQKQAEAAVETAKELSKNKELDIYIKAVNYTQYSSFKILVAALKAKNIFKYKLITPE